MGPRPWCTEPRSPEAPKHRALCSTFSLWNPAASLTAAHRSSLLQLFGSVEGRDAFTVNPVLLRPRSRGRVRLRSANPFHWPLFYPNYYQDEEDLRVMVEGIKMVSVLPSNTSPNSPKFVKDLVLLLLSAQAVQLGETSGFRRWGARLYDRAVPGCENGRGSPLCWRFSAQRAGYG